MHEKGEEKNWDIQTQRLYYRKGREEKGREEKGRKGKLGARGFYMHWIGLGWIYEGIGNFSYFEWVD